MTSIADITSRQRVDRLLVSRGFFESRALAQAAIAAGLVTADGILIRKASEEISANAIVVAQRPHPYVSRGGIKLAAALDHYHIDVSGRICLDVGASTGGIQRSLAVASRQVRLRRRRRARTAAPFAVGSQ